MTEADDQRFAALEQRMAAAERRSQDVGRSLGEALDWIAELQSSVNELRTRTRRSLVLLNGLERTDTS